MNQDRFHATVCVGSCAVYRRAAVEPFGGVAPIEHSEDMYTGFKMAELGYRVRQSFPATWRTPVVPHFALANNPHRIKYSSKAIILYLYFFRGSWKPVGTITLVRNPEIVSRKRSGDSPTTINCGYGGPRRQPCLSPLNKVNVPTFWKGTVLRSAFKPHVRVRTWRVNTCSLTTALLGWKRIKSRQPQVLLPHSTLFCDHPRWNICRYAWPWAFVLMNRGAFLCSSTDGAWGQLLSCWERNSGARIYRAPTSCVFSTVCCITQRRRWWDFSGGGELAPSIASFLLVLTYTIHHAPPNPFWWDQCPKLNLLKAIDTQKNVVTDGLHPPFTFYTPPPIPVYLHGTCADYDADLAPSWWSFLVLHRVCCPIHHAFDDRHSLLV